MQLPLDVKPRGLSLSAWLNQQIRQAILEGKLPRGARLPPSRELARSLGVSRGAVVAVYEQLQVEGYLSSRVGSGTRVNERLPEDWLEVRREEPPARRPSPVAPFSMARPPRPFRPREPALAEFPIDVWARVASKRLRRLPVSTLAGGDWAGYRPLREAIASYVGAARGVRCSADRVLVTSGAQQAFDLLARLLIRSGDAIWMEDPTYIGAISAFRRAGARIAAIPVDEGGLDPAKGLRLAPEARAAYVTPARQFVLGVPLAAERRMALLAWARQTGAVVIEDDYDSEYRFSGLPLPSLQGLDPDVVAYVGSFNKMLYPSLRLGYLIAPSALVDPLLALRFDTDREPPSVSQAVLCDFISEGHFGRHVRRMRELYARRLAALQEDARRYGAGLLRIAATSAGLYTAAFLENGLRSEEAEQRAWKAGVEAPGFHRFTLERDDLQGLLLGFAAFNEREIRQGVLALAQALEA